MKELPSSRLLRSEQCFNYSLRNNPAERSSSLLRGA